MRKYVWSAAIAAFTLLAGAASARASFAPTEVPEPSTVALFAIGAAGAMAVRRFLIRRRP